MTNKFIPRTLKQLFNEIKENGYQIKLVNTIVEGKDVWSITISEDSGWSDGDDIIKYYEIIGEDVKQVLAGALSMMEINPPGHNI